MLAKRMAIIIFLCSLLSVLLAGCWDEKKIEEHGFVVGTAIDLADEQQTENLMLALTNQFVVPAGIGTPAQGGREQKAVINPTAHGDSKDSTSRNIVEQQ